MAEQVSIPVDGWVLHGMVHQPQGIPAKRVGVVLFHENFNSKFGSHRLFWELSEKLAQAGFYALRYDNRGMCDSPGMRDVTIADRLADGRAAVRFFRAEYELDAVVGWGLCLGASIALHVSASDLPSERLEGLLMCSMLSDPGIVSLPQFGYERTEVSKIAQEFFLRGNVLRKLWNWRRSLKSWLRKLSVLARRYLLPTPNELGRMKEVIGRTGSLLAQYDGPTLLIFGEKDSYLTDFVERVNPDDRLGLKRKKYPPGWVLIKDGDHTFSSREKTNELFRYTIGWLEPFLEGRLPEPPRTVGNELPGVAVAQSV